MIKQSLEEILRRIHMASQRGGRDPREVTLVAVAKAQPSEKIIEAIQAGQRDFGENYAQELLAHWTMEARWHFIGHLQRNKVKQIIGLVSLIQSVDSIDLAREIDRRAATAGKVQPVLIEVNVGGETSKSGVDPEEVEGFVIQLLALSNIDLRGFMTMPPYSEDPEEVRPFFSRLRQIRDAINVKNVYKHPLSDLSMGMTGDFEVAIEEGATIIRIGTGIFGEREKNQEG